MRCYNSCLLITQLLYFHIEAYYIPLASLFLLSFNFSIDLQILGNFSSCSTTQLHSFAPNAFLNLALCLSIT